MARFTLASAEQASSHEPFVASPELSGTPLLPSWRSAAAKAYLRRPAANGCGKVLPSGLTSGKTALRSLQSGNLKRTYRLHIPAGATSDRPLPLVLNFHGRTGTGIDQELVSGLLPLSDREQFVLVSPDGTGTPMGWSAGATEPNTVDDVRFAADMLDAVTSDLCIDAARVYATGFSNGAFMASRLACAMPDRIAAVAAVGGVHYPAERCQAAVPMLAVHGTADTIVPIDGGIVRKWRYGGAFQAIEDWAGNNGCRPAATTASLAESVTRRAYRDCGAPTEIVTMEGSGHVWPGSPGLQAGTPETRISGAELVWSFLSGKRLAE